MTSQQQSECVSRCFQHGGGRIEMHGGCIVLLFMRWYEVRDLVGGNA